MSSHQANCARSGRVRDQNHLWGRWNLGELVCWALMERTLRPIAWVPPLLLAFLVGLAQAENVAVISGDLTLM